MDGQADRLRARVAAAAPAGPAPPVQGRGAPRLARTVAVASGKGGVGKSTVALAVAMAAAERGLKVALVDADLGLANLDVLCGVRARCTAADWLGGRATLAECFVGIAPRLWLLPGASGISQLADLDGASRTRLVEGLARVAGHVDLMVVDLGAGIGSGTLDIAAAADRLLLVSTPEPTALADAYGFAKACVHRGRVGSWHAVATMAMEGNEGCDALVRLAEVARRHLGIDVTAAGVVPLDPEVPRSVRMCVPLLRVAPRSAASRALRAVEAQLQGDVGGEGAGIPGVEPFLAALAARVGVRWGSIAASLAAGVAGMGGVSVR